MATAGPALVGEAISIASAAVDELEALVREHASLVYRVAYAALRNRAEAEDAAQETFVRVLRRRQQLPEVRLEEAARAVRELRAAGASAEQLAADAQMLALLERLIASLPRDLREALTLSTVEEMSAAEGAAAPGIP